MNASHSTHDTRERTEAGLTRAHETAREASPQDTAGGVRTRLPRPEATPVKSPHCEESTLVSSASAQGPTSAAIEVSD